MAKNTVFSTKKTLNIRGNLVDLSEPKVMGILNVTPDSFYEGSRVESITEVISRAEQMVVDGATFIDVGGYSSRPGAEDISVQEEINRVIPVISSLRKRFDEVFISIDTFRGEVARAAVNEGADLINDISGGNLDETMFETVTDLNVPYILMHMRGNPQTMTKEINYDNLLLDIIDYFQKKVSQLRKSGVSDIILDPGFGFSKTVDQNYEILKNLKYFEVLELPLLVGMSRKSMIYRSLGLTAGEALNGTTVLNTIALTNGASILRVHDVKEAVEVVELYKMTYK